MVTAWVMWLCGTAGTTTPLDAVPLKHDVERHLGAEEKGERAMRERERERKEEREEGENIFLNKNRVV